MEIIREPLPEEVILATASADAKARDILEDIREKGDHCVDHLCGCE